MAPTLVKPATSIGPGWILRAPLASLEPTNTVVGSKFTDAWDAAWVVVGATDAGHVFNFQTNVEPVPAAEFFDPLSYETESREGTFDFALLHIAARSFVTAFNGGVTATSGAGTTLRTDYEPPDPGNEVRCMLGWESQDSTQRMVLRQCFQGGQASLTHNKGAANRTAIPLSFRLELPDTGQRLWKRSFAGTARGL
ncbi:hypothetical protein ACFFX1_55005 [Dactylosporangium sucinum]|uniref:Uncharacterized protein n=1 Tax=Dactylosporangium sucinum TaxID=1424081 RepID=A0A917X1K7_9ACTN|nr:hypothetical protein [Dactylosporangium sucinum]GGM53241.1 hypothetical protein GCM10007977_063590 [Dactylosporangium sucinum]